MMGTTLSMRKVYICSILDIAVKKQTYKNLNFFHEIRSFILESIK